MSNGNKSTRTDYENKPLRLCSPRKGRAVVPDIPLAPKRPHRYYCYRDYAIQSKARDREHEKKWEDAKAGHQMPTDLKHVKRWRLRALYTTLLITSYVLFGLILAFVCQMNKYSIHRGENVTTELISLGHNGFFRRVSLLDTSWCHGLDQAIMQDCNSGLLLLQPDDERAYRWLSDVSFSYSMTSIDNEAMYLKEWSGVHSSKTFYEKKLGLEFHKEEPIQELILILPIPDDLLRESTEDAANEEVEVLAKLYQQHPFGSLASPVTLTEVLEVVDIKIFDFNREALADPLQVSVSVLTTSFKFLKLPQHYFHPIRSSIFMDAYEIELFFAKKKQAHISVQEIDEAGSESSLAADPEAEHCKGSFFVCPFMNQDVCKRPVQQFNDLTRYTNEGNEDDSLQETNMESSRNLGLVFQSDEASRDVWIDGAEMLVVDRFKSKKTALLSVVVEIMDGTRVVYLLSGFQSLRQFVQVGATLFPKAVIGVLAKTSMRLYIETLAKNEVSNMTLTSARVDPLPCIRLRRDPPTIQISDLGPIKDDVFTLSLLGHQPFIESCIWNSVLVDKSCTELLEACMEAETKLFRTCSTIELTQVFRQATSNYFPQNPIVTLRVRHRKRYPYAGEEIYQEPERSYYAAMLIRLSGFVFHNPSNKVNGLHGSAARVDYLLGFDDYFVQLEYL